MAVLLLVSIGVLFFLTGHAIADAALWGMAVLLAILNLGALIESRDSSHPVLAAVAMILSWIVIGVWWSSAAISSALVPALIVVGAFSVLVVAGNLWASRQSEAAGEFESGVYLAIVGHLFLMFVATQRMLAIPPWPMFAILVVLDLALGAAALYLRRARLMTAALVASQVVLLIWAVVATGGHWPVVALGACIVIAALGMVWFAIDRRFTESAAAALVGAYVVAIAAGIATDTSIYGWLLAAQIVLTIAILALAWIADRHALAVVAAVATAVATVASDAGSPSRLFAFGCVLYAIIVAYPLLLGARAKRSIEPYLAAVLASAWFFFVARYAMVDAKLEANHRRPAGRRGDRADAGLRAPAPHRAASRSGAVAAGSGRRRCARVHHCRHSAAARKAVDHDRLGPRGRRAGVALLEDPSPWAAAVGGSASGRSLREAVAQSRRALVPPDERRRGGQLVPLRLPDLRSRHVRRRTAGGS